MPPAMARAAARERKIMFLFGTTVCFIDSSVWWLPHGIFLQARGSDIPRDEGIEKVQARADSAGHG
jgi:zona occludens toxin (predicted ATPase)